MRRIILTAALCIAAPLALAGDKEAQQSKKAAAAQDCGDKLADDAKYPQQLSRTLTQVANLYQAHAQWIGTGDAASRAEHELLQKLAQEHRELAERSQRLTASLRSARDLPPSPHRGAPPPELTQAMQNTLKEMRTFAQLLEQGVRDGQQQLQAMRQGAQSSAQQGTGGSGAPTEPRTP